MFISIVLLVAIFGVYFLISADEPFFTATVTDEQGLVTAEDQLQSAKSVELTQSIFDRLEKVNVFSLQASTPLRTHEPNFGQFVVVVDNPFNSQAILENIEVKQNDELLYVYEPVGLVLQPGQSYTYTTEQIDLNANLGAQNTVAIDAFLRSGVEEEYFSYEYSYLSLYICQDDSVCPNLYPVCDLANGAKLSKDPSVHYCVRICNNHNDCNVGQICKQGGYCGY